MDLSLDNNYASPTYGDLVLGADGDLVATSDINPAGTNFVLQHILQRLRTFRGEWFMDNTLGVPYFQDILVRNPNRANVELDFADVILSTPGVTALTAIETTYISSQRVMHLSFAVASVAGPITYSGPVGYAVPQGAS